MFGGDRGATPRLANLARTKRHSLQAPYRSRDYNGLSKGEATIIREVQHQAQHAEMSAFNDLKTSSDNIRSEYTKRVTEAKKLLETVKTHLEGLRAEIERVGTLRTHVVGVLSDFQRPLQLTMEMMGMRSGAKVCGDAVEASLHLCGAELRRDIGLVSTFLSELDANLSEIHKVEARYQADIESKSMTIAVDRAAAEGKLEIPLNAILPRSNLLCQTSSLHTEDEWRNLTRSLLSAGLVAVEKSCALRKRIVRAIDGIKKSGVFSRLPPTVVDALNQRMKQSGAMMKAHEASAHLMTAELGKLEKTRGRVEESLGTVRNQMRSVRQRLDMRVVKPSSEQLRMGIEETLEIELKRLRRAEAALERELPEIEKKQGRHKVLARQLERETSQTRKAFELDERCKGISLPMIPTPRGSAAQPPVVVSYSARTGS